MKYFSDLNGKTIVVTGASSGIGKQCAIQLSNLGCVLIMIARNEDRLKSVYNSLKKGNHLYFSKDITKYDEFEDIIQYSVNRIGPVGGLIHSAGIEQTLPLRSMQSKIYNNLFSVNVISGFELSKIISKKRYLDSHGASFVFISSIMGLLGQSGKIGYCSSKGALIAGAKAMALELATRNIRVNCVLPGIVETEMSKKLFEQISENSVNMILASHPLGMGKPFDIANACIFLLSDMSRWITGTNMIVDGGYSIS